MAKRKQTLETKIGIIKKLVGYIGGPNKKSESKAVRKLREFAPEDLQAAGVDPNKFPPADQTLVYKSGTVGHMYSATEDIELEMRARLEYYNTLARAARPFLDEYNRIVDGPNQRALQKLSEEISAQYDAIREINQASRKHVQSPAVDALLDKIKALKTEREPLFKLARKERRDAEKLHKDQLTELKKTFGADTIRSLRHDRPKCVRTAGTAETPAAAIASKSASQRTTLLGLFEGNYRSAEEDFGVAMKRAMLDGTPIHLHNEWKGEAENIITTKFWNGEGAITSLGSGLGDKKVAPADRLHKQTWGEILAGKNRYLQARKMTPADLAVHGLKETFHIDDRLWLVSIRLRKGWVSLPVFLHRVPNTSDRITESSFIVRKEGFQRKTYFHMTVSFETAVAVGTEKVSVTPVWERQADGSLLVARWTKGTASGEEFLPEDTRLAHAAELDELVSDHLGTANTERVKRGLTPEKRGKLRAIAHGEVLVPKSGTVRDNLREVCAKNLREVCAKIRSLEAKHGKYMGDETVFFDLMIAEVMSRFVFASKESATNYTIAMIFTQKFQHLWPWAVNERSKALAARKERYRILAKNLLTGACSLSLPDKDYRTRNASDDQKQASPSELVQALENYAKKCGISVTRFEQVEAAKA